jgi:RNA polymerase sigma-70 factor, ECF subfamily
MHNGYLHSGHVPVSAARLRPSSAVSDGSDRILLENIAAGDRLAMRALYARHSVKVYRFVLRLVGDDNKAEDIVSEVFFDVWRQAGRFEGRSQVSTWILAIARYKAISVMRQRQDEALDEETLKTIADDSDDPQETLEKKDTGYLLRLCVQQLSPQHREIIDLVYYHEKSVDEAAEIVGVPANTVKTRMFYARKRVSELYAQAGGQRLWQ